MRLNSILALLLVGCGGSSSDAPDASNLVDAIPGAPDAPPGAPDANNPGSPDAALTGGCNGSGAATGVVNDSITVRGTERTYILSVPSGYDSSQAYALVFAFHGLGSNGSQARYYFGVEEASSGSAIVIYPDGLPKYGSGTQTGWDWNPQGEDFELFDALLARLTETYCVDDGRVFATGHSHGGFFSNSLGCGRAESLRAIAPVAGGGPYFACDDLGVAAWIAHGIDDSTVAFSYGEASRDHWRGHNGCDTTTSDTSPSPCVAYDGCDTGFPVVWCAHSETEFGGHWWPSFAPQAIWAFFAGLP